MTILLEANQTQISGSDECGSPRSAEVLGTFILKQNVLRHGLEMEIFSSVAQETRSLKKLAAPIRVAESGRRDATAFAHQTSAVQHSFSFILLSHNSVAQLLTPLNCPLWRKLQMG